MFFLFLPKINWSNLCRIKFGMRFFPMRATWPVYLSLANLQYQWNTAMWHHFLLEGMNLFKINGSDIAVFVSTTYKMSFYFEAGTTPQDDLSSIIALAVILHLKIKTLFLPAHFRSSNSSRFGTFQHCKCKLAANSSHAYALSTQAN